MEGIKATRRGFPPRSAPGVGSCRTCAASPASRHSWRRRRPCLLQRARAGFLCLVCREVVKTVDLRKPHMWFPVARALQRRWAAGRGAGAAPRRAAARGRAAWAASPAACCCGSVPCTACALALPAGLQPSPPCVPGHTPSPCCSCAPCSIVYHAGPTNSGKTYNALQAMCGAASGVYCGPLRRAAGRRG